MTFSEVPSEAPPAGPPKKFVSPGTEETYELVRVIGSGVALALAVVLGVAMVALAVVLAVRSTDPYSGLDLYPIPLAVAYLVLPLLLVLASVGWNRHAATAARKFLIAGIATLLPAGLLLIALGLGNPLGLVGVVPIVAALVVAPALFCFRAAGAVRRGDLDAALRASRVAVSWTLGSAGLTAVLLIPLALSGVGETDCDVCPQVPLSIIGLAGYTAPTLVAGLLAGHARLWVRTRLLQDADSPAS